MYFEETRKDERAGGLFGINLALSNLCGGGCIFCPEGRGRRIPKNMPIEYAKKIIDEASSYKFRSIHVIKRFEVGENGDALLNPSFVDILRYIRQNFQSVFIELSTSFQNLKRDMSDVIISEHLLDNVGVNIDGYDPENYYRVKRMDYREIEQNILDFIEVRKRKGVKIPLNVLCLTYYDYVTSIYKTFGRMPKKIRQTQGALKIKDDYKLVEQVWRSRLESFDHLHRLKVGLWAERDLVDRNRDMSSYTCPLYERVKKECFIAPNGDWYACCRDDQQQNVFGNVIEQSIQEIWNSQKRHDFLRLLKQHKYSDIGYPCNTIVACQNLYHPEDLVKTILNLEIKESIKNPQDFIKNTKKALIIMHTQFLLSKNSS
jgi:radical SAM protein with 4Fe4S-binding SPASM domain